MARVRFAPSPTGMLHLGGARTALFNYLYAKNIEGSFVLRIEDTDKERNVPGSTRNLLDSLQWLGLRYDEGPSVGGKFGPYVQSERLSLYREHADHMVRLEKAYPCFCSQERLKSLHSSAEHPTGYDGHCRRLSKRQVQEKLQMGSPYVIRLMAPSSGSTVICDEVYGQVEVANLEINDQVLLKSDGMPTYHLASVIDDHHMEISHVLRGVELLVSTAKHLLLYSAFNWTPPTYAHLPLLMSSSGRKLSKRNDDVFVQQYKERGFQPEAIINYLAPVGWRREQEPDDEGMAQEIYSVNELIQTFSLSGIKKTPTILDESKLAWMNKHYFKQKLKRDSGLNDLAMNLQSEVCKLYDIAVEDDLVSVPRMKQILLLLEDRVTLLPKIAQNVSYFWISPSLHSQLFEMSKIEDKVNCLSFVKKTLDECDFDDLDGLNVAMKQMATKLELSFKQLMPLLRLAITGCKSTPGLTALMQILGKVTVVKRLDNAITVIRGS